MTERVPDANFIEAFKKALAEYYGLTAGGKEPDVSFRPLHGPQEPKKMSSMASMAMEYGDCPLPDDVLNSLAGLMDDTGENPQMKVHLRNNPTWKTAGRVFEMIAVRNKQFRNTK